MSGKFLTISSFVLLVVAASWSVPVPDTDTTAGADETTTQKSDMIDDDHHGHSSNHDLKISQDIIKGGIVCSENKNLTLAPEFKKEIEPCMDPAVYGTEEGMKNPKCGFFCSGHAIGILDDHGVPTKELYDQFLEAALPEKEMEKAKAHVHKCLDDFGSKVDPKDAHCEGAGDLHKCVVDALSMDCE